jgi:hypothetical protein
MMLKRLCTPQLPFRGVVFLTTRCEAACPEDAGRSGDLGAITGSTELLILSGLLLNCPKDATLREHPARTPMRLED